MRNFEVAWLLSELADRLEIIGENKFKVLAYRKAARALESLPGHFDDMYRAGTLQAVPGIGSAIHAKIGELLDKGEIGLLARLRREMPPGVMEMLRIPGVGPRLAGIFVAEGIADVDSLREAALARRLRAVKGVGPKAELNVLRGIERLTRGPERLPLGISLPIAVSLRDGLRRLAEVQRAEIAGSIRRAQETTGDIDILVATVEPAVVISYFSGLPQVHEILAAGETKVSVLHHSGVQADLRVVTPEQFPAAWQYFTGSKEHNTRLRRLAKAQGYRLSEYGLFPTLEDRAPVHLEDEADVYRHLGLEYVPPEIREDRGEIEAAQRGDVPRLLSLSEIRGDLHVHSHYSDGISTLEDLARTAGRLGYEFVAVCDHSRSLAIAHGLDEARLLRQGEEIAAINRKREGAYLLRGIEVDILSDGRLDLPDEVLAELDIVVASIHSGFKQSAEHLLHRVEQALENEHVDILAHPSGRLIGRREAYALDLARVVELAAKTGTVLEINSSPDRLDLSDVWARKAVESGVRLSINTDAHSAEQFEYMGFGVGTARRGWASAEDVLNTMPLTDLMKWLRLPKGQRRRYAVCSTC